MATEAQVQRERKAGLRAVRRDQRAADTNLEKWERECFRLLRKKRLIDYEDADRLLNLYNTFSASVQKWEASFANFLKLLSS